MPQAVRLAQEKNLGGSIRQGFLMPLNQQTNAAPTIINRMNSTTISAKPLPQEAPPTG
jgi:hypothetical protein